MMLDAQILYVAIAGEIRCSGGNQLFKRVSLLLVVAEICIKMHTLCGELECTREFVAAMQTRGNLLGRP